MALDAEKPPQQQAQQPQQQRVRNACEACHERKIKCKITPGSDSCQTCAATGRHCYFLPRIKAGRPRRKPLNTTSSSTTPASASASGTSLSSIATSIGHISADNASTASPIDESSSHATSPRSASPSTTENASTSLYDESVSNFFTRDFDSSALLTPSFPWSQVGGAASSAVGQDYIQETNPFDQIMGDAINDMDTNFDASAMLENLSAPALSPDGSRDSASSTMPSGPPTAFASSGMFHPEAKENPFFASHIKHQQHSTPSSDVGMTSPVFSMHSQTLPQTLSPTTRKPCFQDLLVKSSEIERLLESLQYASAIGLNLDTSSVENNLQKMISSIESAGDLVLTVLSNFLRDLQPTNNNIVDSPRLHIQQQQMMQRHLQRQQQGSTQDQQVHHQQMMQPSESQYNYSSVNPAFLTKSSDDRFEAPLHSDMSPQNLALRALVLALSLRILDACEALSNLQPSDPNSHLHVLFLKRLDVNLVQVRTALQQMELAQLMTRDALMIKAKHRTYNLHAKLNAAMGEDNSGGQTLPQPPPQVHW